MPPLTDLTPAQLKRQTKLEQDAARVAGGEAAKSADQAPTPLHVMLSQGMTVMLGGKEYEAAPLPIAKLGKAGPLLGALPDTITAHAHAAYVAGHFDVEATTTKLNDLFALRNKLAVKTEAGQDAEAGKVSNLTREAVEMLLDAAVSETTEEEAKAMVDLTLLVLSRRHPALTREEVEAELEMPAFMYVLVSLYAGSPTLRRTFRPI